MVSDKQYQEPIASELERLRDDARSKRAIIYDCLNAAVGVGDRVACRKGHPFAGTSDGAVPLIGVLRGRTPSICSSCGDGNFDDEPEQVV